MQCNAISASAHVRTARKGITVLVVKKKRTLQKNLLRYVYYFDQCFLVFVTYNSL